MKRDTLIDAMSEAQRFLRKAHSLQLAQPETGTKYFDASKESGAVLRSSMDLTRALAVLRRHD